MILCMLLGEATGGGDRTGRLQERVAAEKTVVVVTAVALLHTQRCLVEPKKCDLKNGVCKKIRCKRSLTWCFLCALMYMHFTYICYVTTKRGNPNYTFGLSLIYINFEINMYRYTINEKMI